MSEIAALLRGECRSLCHSVDGVCRVDAPTPVVVFPGSFNPFHAGHRALATAVERRLGMTLHFELSVSNVDKPDLSADDIQRRLSQFLGVAPVWVTKAATFEAKANLFPNAVFVLGWDTAIRLIDPRYYGDALARRDDALRNLRSRGIRFLVGGRLDRDGAFQTWDSSIIAIEFRDLFEQISEDEFRVDLSSTQLRRVAE